MVGALDTVNGPLCSAKSGSYKLEEFLFSFCSSTSLHCVPAREDVLSSGASVEETDHGNQEEEEEVNVN
jgi:hypothetical protein